METPTSQSINLTERADLESQPEQPAISLDRDPRNVPPHTAPAHYQLNQVIEYAVSQGREPDANGYIDLRGLTCHGKDGETWVIRDQYIKRTVDTKARIPEPVAPFIKRTVKDIARHTHLRDPRERDVEGIADTVAEQIDRGRQASFARIRSAWARKPRTYGVGSHKGRFGEPVLDRDGNQKRTRLPHPTMHDGYGPIIGRGQPDRTPIIHDTLTFDVDVYDLDGNLSRQQNWSLGNLTHYLHDPDNPTDLSLSQELSPKSPGELPADKQIHADIPITKRRDPFTDIMNYLKGEGLPDSLVGITWHQNGFRFQVVDDVLLRERVRSRTYGRHEFVRTFKVRRYDAAGNVLDEKLYRDAALQDHLKDLVTPTKKKGLENIPKKNFRPLERIYRVSPKTEETEQDRESPSTFLKLWDRISVFRLLDESDISDAQHPRKSVLDIMNDPSAKLHLPALVNAASEYGRDKIKELAEQIRDTYLKSIDLLELPAADRTYFSMSWVLREMLEQRYYAEHPEQVDQVQIDKYGLTEQAKNLHHPNTVPDPFADTAEGLEARRKLLQRAVAIQYIHAALKPEYAKQQVKDADGAPRLKENGDPAYEVIKVYGEDDSVTEKLQDIVRPRIMELIGHKVGEEVVDRADMGLGQIELIEIGDLLLRQFPDRVLNK